MLLWHCSTQSDFSQRQLGELSDHELKPTVRVLTALLLGKCCFEQKGGAPHELYVTLYSVCAVHTRVSCLRGLHSSESIPPSLGDHRLPDYKLHSTQLFSYQS